MWNNKTMKLEFLDLDSRARGKETDNVPCEDLDISASDEAYYG